MFLARECPRWKGTPRHREFKKHRAGKTRAVLIQVGCNAFLLRGAARDKLVAFRKPRSWKRSLPAEPSRRASSEAQAQAQAA